MNVEIIPSLVNIRFACEFKAEASNAQECFKKKEGEREREREKEKEKKKDFLDL